VPYARTRRTRIGQGVVGATEQREIDCALADLDGFPAAFRLTVVASCAALWWGWPRR